MPILRRKTATQKVPCPAFHFGWLWKPPAQPKGFLHLCPAVLIPTDSVGLGVCTRLPLQGCGKAVAAKGREPDTCLIYPTPLLDLLHFSGARRKLSNQNMLISKQFTSVKCSEPRQALGHGNINFCTAALGSQSTAREVISPELAKCRTN